MILVQFAGLIVWLQGSEVNLEGVRKANEPMTKAAKVTCAAFTEG